MAKAKVSIPAEVVKQKREPKPGTLLTAPALAQRFNELVDVSESIDGDLSYSLKPKAAKEDLEALAADQDKFISILSASRPGHALLNGVQDKRDAVEALLKA